MTTFLFWRQQWSFSTKKRKKEEEEETLKAESSFFVIQYRLQKRLMTVRGNLDGLGCNGGYRGGGEGYVHHNG